MTDEKWAAVWEVFIEARDTPLGERGLLLETKRMDPAMRAEVQALLEVSVSCSTIASGAVFDRWSPQPAYPAGREFSRYVIVDLIGEGGFGRIYAARDKELRRVVALKFLAGPLRGDSQKLMEEAQAASALNHPNIVTIYETIATEDYFAIVMEFVDGQSLRHLLRANHGPLPAMRAMDYGRQIAQALAAAHDAGIAHHDVKPENILVRADDYVKLVDFGLATNLRTMTPGAGPMTGTLRYLAPEGLRGDTASSAADIFSLGLVLYEMTAGRHPFAGDTPLGTANAIASQQLVPPSRVACGVPAALDALIVAMLSKNPAARPAALEVVRRLEGATDRSGRAARRFGWALIASICVAVALTAGLARRWRDPAPFGLRLHTRPLTGQGGRENSPALSPDGRYVVFDWREKEGDPPATFLREIDTDRTTTLPIAGPFAWLPDSKRIAFPRTQQGLTTLHSISLQGTDEKKVLEAEGIVRFDWSADGRWIGISALTKKDGPQAIFVQSTRSGERKQVTFPPATLQGDRDFSFSPDGKQLAFRRKFSFVSSDVFVIDLPEPGTPRQVTFHQTEGEAVAWTRDGKAVIASTFRGANFSLWLHPLASPGQPSRLTEVGVETYSIRSAIEKNRLSWVNAFDDANIWRVPAAGGTPVRVIASAMRDRDVAWSSRGVLAYRSDRSGYPEIWISLGSGESQRKVTDLKAFTGSPRWSPDGRRLAFGSHRGEGAEVFTMDCDPVALQCGQPVQVTHDPAIDTVPTWSQDGSHLYFASQRSGAWQVWRVDSGSQRPPTQMTSQGGLFAAESPDGNWLYYSRVESPQALGLWRKPLPGNPHARFRVEDPGEKLLPMDFSGTDTWTLSGQEIFYENLSRNEGPQGIWAFDLVNNRKRLVHQERDLPLARGLAVSPDGKWILFARADRSESTIVVADYDIVQ